MTHFSKQAKITMLASIGFGLFNPATVAVLEEYFKWFYTGVFVLCGAWLVFVILKSAFKTEQVNVPKKSAKTLKLGKLIET